jgi:hypothetical protein
VLCLLSLVFEVWCVLWWGTIINDFNFVIVIWVSIALFSWIHVNCELPHLLLLILFPSCLQRLLILVHLRIKLFALILKLLLIGLLFTIFRVTLWTYDHSLGWFSFFGFCFRIVVVVFFSFTVLSLWRFWLREIKLRNSLRTTRDGLPLRWLPLSIILSTWVVVRTAINTQCLLILPRGCAWAINFHNKSTLSGLLLLSLGIII